MYLIHELSHIASNVEQHPKRFWEVFKWLLHEAKNNDSINPIYKYINFKKDTVNYCGILQVNYSPEDDNDLNEIKGGKLDNAKKELSLLSPVTEYEQYGNLYDNIKDINKL